MTEPQERLQQIASTFGGSDIKIFIGRDLIHPGKPVSEAKVQQLENALKSPEKERSAINVKEGKNTIYRSIEGVVTADTKGVAAQFQTPKSNYFDLLQGFADKVPGYFENQLTPEFVSQQLNSFNPSVSSNTQSFGESIDRWVMTEAIDRGMPKDEAINLVQAQSPYVAKLAQGQATHPKAFQDYVAAEGGTLSREYDHAFDIHPKAAPALSQESLSVPQTAETTPVELATSQPSALPQLDLSTVAKGNLSQPPQTKDEQLRTAIEPKLTEQMKSASQNVKPGGAIIPVTQSKAVIPIEPTPQQLHQTMPALVTPLPSKPSEQPSLEQALASANTRIDALQKQLDSTTASVQNLSTQLQDRSLKGWAKNTVQKLETTAQTFAVHAKTNVANVGQWVNQGINQIQQKAQHFKAIAEQSVGYVKLASQVKTIEVKEAVRSKVNDLLSPVDSTALTKAADRMINQWGHAGKYEGNTFNFQRSSSGDISIQTKDGTPVFAKGTVTDQADAKTIAHLSQIPRRLEVVQNHTSTPEKTAKQQAFAR
jgi:hypothetical protein